MKRATVMILILSLCYRRSLDLAMQHGVRTIAFPAISCGVYGYPIEAATEIAVRETSRAKLDRVIFACFSDDIFRAYQRVLARSLPL